MTRESAIEILVAMDVARWGESERKASRNMHRRDRPTVGLAVNGIASRCEVYEGEAWLSPALEVMSASEWRRTADSLLTHDDWARLRQGG